jgi:MerR family transcriptional regulator, light-induced transcriptional regulator
MKDEAFRERITPERFDESFSFNGAQKPEITRLVEVALKSIAAEAVGIEPRSRKIWIERLGDALMSSSVLDHQNVLSVLMAYGVSKEELFQSYIPEVARYLGEQWVSDRVSFVDVTTGASRLQALFRGHEGAGDTGSNLGRNAPPGQSVLMVIPQFEQHSLGAFVASDELRRLGLWVRIAIGVGNCELWEIVSKNRFSMVGLSLSTWKSVEKAAGVVDYLRANASCLPPVVAGGRVVEDRKSVEKRTGVDFAVKSIREAVERCGLTAVASLTSERGVL